MLSGQNTDGNRKLIIGILGQVIQDIVCCPDAKLSLAGSYRKDSPQDRSVDAMRFMDLSNYKLLYYCRILDLEPSYVIKKMRDTISRLTMQDELERERKENKRVERKRRKQKREINSKNILWVGDEETPLKAA